MRQAWSASWTSTEVSMHRPPPSGLGMFGESVELNALFKYTGPDRRPEIDAMMQSLGTDMKIGVTKRGTAGATNDGMTLYVLTVPDELIVPTVKAELTSRLRGLNGLGAPPGSTVTVTVSPVAAATPTPEPTPQPTPNSPPFVPPVVNVVQSPSKAWLWFLGLGLAAYAGRRFVWNRR